MSAAMRTKRRYAHELFPHADEAEIRSLEVEVPYLYARALGLNVNGTSWFDMRGDAIGRAHDRTMLLIAARERALHADALLQGLAGQEAWEWAESRLDEEGEWIWERAVRYGINPDMIKPYPCGPEPAKHEHLSPRDAAGCATVTFVEGPESECADCCEATP